VKRKGTKGASFLIMKASSPLKTIFDTAGYFVGFFVRIGIKRSQHMPQRGNYRSRNCCFNLVWL